VGTIMSSQINVGLIGAGFIAEWHAKALKAVPGTRLAAVCDRDGWRARSVAARFGAATVCTSIEELLRPGHALDAVHVLLPPQVHEVAARAALEAGVDVLVEKPMGTDAAECARLVELAAERSRRIGVSHNFLFYPVYERLIADIRGGALGVIDHVRITWAKELPQITNGPFHHWMFAKPEYLILEIGPHSVAHLLHLAQVCAETNREDPAIVDTSVRVSKPVQLPGQRVTFQRWQVEVMAGSTALQAEWSFVPGFGEHCIHVRGALGSATVDLDRNVYVVERHTGRHVDFDRLAVLSGTAAAVRRQGRRNLADYVLGKLGLSTRGNVFAASIAGALRAFYAGGRGEPLDRRIDGRMGQQVVEWCQRIGAEAADRAPAIARPSRRPALAKAPDVLVLGGSGFIGRAVVRKLAETGHVVRVASRSGIAVPSPELADHIEMVQGDVRKGEDLDRLLPGIRSVLHLALAAATTWEEWYQQDVEATRLVAEKCLQHGVQRLIYTGTIASLDESDRNRTITDETPVEDEDVLHEFYPRAKSASEKVLRGLHATRGLDVVIVRPGVVLGTGGSPWHLGIAKWSFNRVAHLWGDGRAPLPIVLVDDVADAMVAAMTAPDVAGRTFNLVGPPMLTARDYIAELESYTGMKFEVVSRPAWRVFSGEVVKWLAKVAVRHQPRHRPRLKEWQGRGHLSRYDCSSSARLLRWTPTGDRATVVEQGVHRPADEFILKAAGVRRRVRGGA
jgi:predicted dehydrogenase/nucleoside-diphosphate-sugar epimerase